jgi:hypothetical protein
VREVEWVVFLGSSRPCRDGTAIEVEQEGDQTAVDGIEDVIMAGDLNGVFWPWGVFCSRRWTLFNNSAETEPLLILMVCDETMAPTCRAKVASILLGAVICSEFGERVLGWRRLEFWESGAQGAGCVAAGVAMTDLNSYWDF